jgi:hypothetical protein
LVSTAWVLDDSVRWRIIGYRNLATLVIAIARHATLVAQ